MNTLPYSTPDYDDVTGDSGKVDNNFWYRDVSELLGARTPPRQEYISIYGRLLVGELLHYLNVKIIILNINEYVNMIFLSHLD